MGWSYRHNGEQKPSTEDESAARAAYDTHAARGDDADLIQTRGSEDTGAESSHIVASTRGRRS